MAETIFDKILAKRIPAKIAFEDESVLAFHDIHPQAPVHVLVIPKKKLRSFHELNQWSAEETGLFMHKVAHVAQTLGLHPKGYRVVFNTGLEGGQSVDYIHAHILGGTPLNGAFA